MIPGRPPFPGCPPTPRRPATTYRLIIAPQGGRHGSANCYADRSAGPPNARELSPYHLANGAILDLHQRFRFEELTDFSFPGPLGNRTCVAAQAELK